VLGHVQSGKTANYLGVINKAADTGYKLIVLIAGIHNNLRRQTQFRVDEGFVGRPSDIVLKGRRAQAESSSYVGVGLLNRQRVPMVFTSTANDFSAQKAQGTGVAVDSSREPIILVIKKNKSILENLIAWLRHNNARDQDIIDLPFLLIDDEADNASVNVAKESQEPTAINGLIRQLLALFTRSSYVGYTATPFANIFIDPDSTEEMLGDDLFPRDYIVSLDAPTNYVGAASYFDEKSSKERLIFIDDAADALPRGHDSTFRPEMLPPSLEEAVRSFAIARAIRLVRGDKKAHCSMLVNVSFYTGVQTQVASLITSYLRKLQLAVRGHGALPVAEALRNPAVRSLQMTWSERFSNSGVEWSLIQAQLHDSLAPVEVREVNSKSGPAALAYDQYRESGLSVIAVGGNSLSRGVTLEGLCVSYFLRNSQMYDTLMQMARWFGYRDGYEDVCRVYITRQAAGWYAHIAAASQELRSEIKRMEAEQLTPKEFGLAVRAHPDSLIVTARNKMRTGIEQVRQIDLANRLVETAYIQSSDRSIEHNFRLASAVVTALGKPKRIGGYYYFEGIFGSQVAQFIGAFDYHKKSLLMQKEPLLKYIEQMCFEQWEIVVPSVGAGGTPVKISEEVVVGLQERRIERAPGRFEGYQISGSSARIASGELPRIGLAKGETSRRHPLLMIHFLKGRLNGELKGNLVGYGIKFPGDPTELTKRVKAEYVLNLIAQREIWGDESIGDEDDATEEG
jgi:hypothetical protein